MERTLVLIKPDAMQRGLAGEIIARLERRGLRIVAMRLLHMDEALARQHYAAHEGKAFFEGLLQLDDATLRGLLRRTDPQIIALALRTSPDKLRHRILAGLSYERRLAVHDHPDFLGPVRLSDIEAAQQELVDLLEIPDHSPAQLVSTTEESPA